MRAIFDTQRLWARNVYPIGVGILLITTIGLSFFGWSGALQIGSWLWGLSASLLAVGLLWLTPRFRILNPVRAHWVRPANPTWLDWGYQAIWNGYEQLSKLSNTFSNVLEGESGIMWTLLFLALFISFFTQRSPKRKVVGITRNRDFGRCGRCLKKRDFDVFLNRENTIALDGRG